MALNGRISPQLLSGDARQTFLDGHQVICFRRESGNRFSRKSPKDFIGLVLRTACRVVDRRSSRTRANCSCSEASCVLRPPICSRRCLIDYGLTVIAHSGSETASPISDACVVLVPADQPQQLHASLVRVQSEVDDRNDLAARSRATFQAHFAWPPIADRFASLLKPE
jgi:hypothetical protein